MLDPKMLDPQMSHQRPSIFRTFVQLLVMGFLVALVGCNSSSSIRDEDAVESAQIITKNRAEVNKIVLSVMEAVDLDNADSNARSNTNTSNPKLFSYLENKLQH